MSTQKSFLAGRKVTKPTFADFEDGLHRVRLVETRELDSFMQYDGKPKPKLPDWNNPTRELAISIVSAEKGKAGSMVYRLNFDGFRKYDELTDEELESGKYTNIRGYACYEKEIEGETYVLREESEKNTEACWNIFNQFTYALGLEEGENVNKAIKQAIEDKREFFVNVITTVYEDKNHKEIDKFKPAKVVTEEAFDK